MVFDARTTTLDPRQMSAYNHPAVQYVSGADVTLGYGQFHFRFELTDFGIRVQSAAVHVGCIEAGPRSPSERSDMITLAAHGALPAPASELGRHLGEHLHWYVDREGDLVYWLRRLIFRDAWVDQQIKEGRIDPVFDDQHGFGYISAVSHEPVADPSRIPDWSAFMYRGSDLLG